MGDTDLSSALERLAALSHGEWSVQPDDVERSRFHALADAVEGLSGERLGEPRVSRMEQARTAWQAHIARGGPIGSRDMGALCWEPEIACSEHFLGILKKRVPLRRRQLRGLMSSYHEKWNLRTRAIERILERTLDTTPRSRGVVAKWSVGRGELIGALAPDRFAESCLAHSVSVTARLTQYGLSPSGQFAREAAAKLAWIVSDPSNSSSSFYFALEASFPEDNNIIDPTPWGEAFRRLITTHALASSSDARQRLIDLALKTRALDDPRLRIGQWQNVPKAAYDLVIQWLSEEDLRFFFDLLMQGRSDPQERRRFWHNYVNRAVRSRVVVGEHDYGRLRPKLDQIRARGRTFARMKGATGVDSKASAFIMDFGEVIVVEFSKPNSACYIYENDLRDPYLDFTQQVFSWNHLKSRFRGEYHSHVSPPRRWHEKFTTILARHGVRPE